MSAWPIVVLGDVCEIVGGGTPSRSRPDFFGGNIPWITPTDVTRSAGRYLAGGAETITEIGLKNSSSKLLPARSVLLTSRATIGFTAINTIPVTTNQGFANFICDQYVWPEYLAYWLEWSRERLIGLASGATFKEINKSTLRKLEVPLPPLDEQQRIVRFLDRAAEIRRRADAARTKARAIIPALFLDMFGDPATNPKGWDIEKLSRSTRFIGGSSLPDGIEFFGQSNGYLHCKVSTLALLENQYGVVTALEWSELPGARSAVAPPNSILFPKRGAAIATNRKRLLRRSASLDPNLMGVLGKAEIYDGRFLLSLFETIDLTSISSGSTVPQLNKQDLAPLEFMVPPLPLQTAFAEQVTRIEAVARALDAAAGKAEAMAAALSAEVFG